MPRERFQCGLGHDPQDLEKKLLVICDIELKVRRGDWLLNHEACITVSMRRDRLRENLAIKFGIGYTSVIATNDLDRDAVLRVYDVLAEVRPDVRPGNRPQKDHRIFPKLF